MEKLQKVARRVLIGIMFFVGVANLFLYAVSFFREELAKQTGPLQYLVMGLLLTVGAFFLLRVKVTYPQKRK